MDEKLRSPQTINGEMQPRHHYIGLESVRKMQQLVKYLREFGINMLAIPTINQIEAGVLAEDFEKGDILGFVNPIEPMGIELTQIIVWDGYGIAAVSIPMFLHKTANGWKIPGEAGYLKLGESENNQPDSEPTEQVHSPKKRKKRTAPKHIKRQKRDHDRVRKNRNY